MFLSVIALALAACGGKGQPTIQPTAPAGPTLVPTFTAVARATAPPAQPTATLSPTPTFTPAPTATPPPTSTATPLPSARLATGRYLQSIGDCDGARREFAGVIADDPNPDEVAEARYRLASCYLRDDAPSEAASVLVQLLASAPPTATHRTPATFLLGEALLTLNRWPEAELSFAAYLPLVPELNALTWQRIGAARRGAGDLPRATEAFSTALKTSPDWANTVAIRRTLADLALAQKDIAGAVAQYDALRGSSTSGAWNAEMHWLAGAALAQAADAASGSNQTPAEARRRWQAAVDADPTSAYAHRAMAALVEAGVAVDEYQRGLVNYFVGKYALANAAFDRLRATDPTGRKGDAWYYAGLSYLRQGQIERGLAELGNLIAAYPENSHWADAWLAQAAGRAQAKDLAAAITTSRQFAEQRPDARQAPTALWRAANWQAESGDLSAAADAYRSLARKYPAADEAWRAYQAAGLIYFQRGDRPAAAETWGEMAGAPLEPFTKPLAYFWLGRAQAAAGDAEAARQAWQKAAQADARSYYGLRAAAWLAKSANQQISTTPMAGAQPATAESDDRGELALWLKSWAGEGSLALPAAVTTDADWRRGQALLDLGRRTQGLAAWARVLERRADDGWALAGLALAFRDAGANHLSITAAEKLAAAGLGQPPANSPAPPTALGRLIYPLPYARLIQQEAGRWNLDPLLLAAVIRQESRFESAATSSASAQGLMQIMPDTAEWIAGQQGRGGFKPEQAYWPYINIDFGAYYLNWALKQLDGSLAAALAGYNGGPGNALRWRKLAPADDDLMVALIDYGETRIYVQQVLGQLDAYRRLYAPGP